MRRILLLKLLIALPTLLFGQTRYNPQVLYDSPLGLFDQDSLRTMDINFYDSNYHNILVDGWKANDGTRLPATIKLSNGIQFDSVAIRYKGNSTFAIPNNKGNRKLPFNIDMNDYVSGQKLMGYKKIKLANSIFDPTFCKEIVAYNIYRKYLPSPTANFIKVNLQDEYLGLYVNTEAVDKQFLKKHFDENDGILFKCDPIQQFGQWFGPNGDANLKWKGLDTTAYYNDYSLKSDYGWTEFVRFMNILENDINNLDSILNIDRVLWAFATNMVIANLDTYNGVFQHNYYMYQTEDGLFQMIPWDATEAFVGILPQFNRNIDELYFYDPFNGYNSANEPLAIIIDDPYSKWGKIYSAHMRTILEESLIFADIENEVDQLQAFCLPAALADPNADYPDAFYTNVDAYYSNGSFKTAGILSTLTIRKDFLENHVDINHEAPEIDSLQIFAFDTLMAVKAKITNADVAVELLTTISPYNSKFISQIMYDDGSHGDEIAGDHFFSAIFPNQTVDQEIKFYVRAENQKAMTVDPPRAEYEFYIYKFLPNAVVNTDSVYTTDTVYTFTPVFVTDTTNTINTIYAGDTTYTINTIIVRDTIYTSDTTFTTYITYSTDTVISIDTSNTSFTTNLYNSSNDSEKVIIYPNPSSSYINIRNNFKHDVEYEVINPLGQLMVRGKITSKIQQLDLSQIPPDIYLIRIEGISYKVVKIE